VSTRALAEIDEVTIESLRRRYVADGLASSDVVEHYLAKIGERHRAGDHAGIVAVNQHARARAEELDAQLARTGTPAGPLHGVPIVIKDQFETVQVGTRFGSRVVPDYRVTTNASVVTALVDAGAILLAKTAMADFGLSLFSRSSLTGYTPNPYDVRRDSGGSSSGTAAAVADNLCVAGIGEDTAGSIRIPASFTSLVGLRPTPGLVGTAGSSPLLKVQDSPGPMTRTVRDAALLLDVLTGSHRLERPTGYLATLDRRGLRGRRIGLLRTPFHDDLDADAPDVQALAAVAAVDLSRAGGIVEQVSMPRTLRWQQRAQAAPSIQRQLAEFLAQRPELAQLSLTTLAECGPEGADLLGLLKVAPAGRHRTYGLLMARLRLRKALVAVLRRHRVDVLCYLTAGLPAPRIADLESGRWTSTTFPALTWLAGQAGVPAISVPAGFTSGGLPVGIEFLAAPYAESTLLQVAFGYEQATRHRRPPRGAA
jgi:amidase